MTAVEPSARPDLNPDAIEIVEDVFETARFQSGKRMMRIGHEDRTWIACEVVRDLQAEGLLDPDRRRT